jgi:hypothetical protein
MNLLEVMIVTESEIALTRCDTPLDKENPDQFCASFAALEVKAGVAPRSACGFGPTASAALGQLAAAISRQIVVRDAADSSRRREWQLPAVTV